MKKTKTVSALLGLLLLPACCAFATRAVTNITVTANGTTDADTALTGLCSATNFVELQSIYYTATNGAVANVSLITKVSGNEANLYTFRASGSGSTAYTCKEVSPRRKVTSNSTPEADKFCLFGTNTVLRVEQTVATTNSWTFNILYITD